MEFAVAGVTPTAESDQPMPESLAGMRVMLVEDNPVNQQVARELLQRLGIEVVVASQGQEALALLAKQPVDCILMDVQMPIMDGFDATRAIRKLEAFTDHQTRIIAMTANAMSSDKDKCLECGMDDYISKPVDEAQLQQTLARWLKD